jgi:uncharacterized integral membrane protein (TIGR00698 family)
VTALSASLTRTAPAPAGNRSGLLCGLGLSAALAAAALGLGKIPAFQDHGFTALTAAIVLGLLLGNTVYPRFASVCADGVGVSKQTLLRAGVVLYGLRLTVQDIGHVGFAGVAVDAVVVTSTFVLAILVGTRWFGLDRKTAMLIGAGSAICGAAAVMATEPVVRARAEQVTIGVATVVVFGTVAIFLYPLLFELNAVWHFIPGGTERFGVYAGSTIHEVAQVVAASRSISADSASTAVIAKMVRVMMLAPFLAALSVWISRDRASDSTAGSSGDSPVPLPTPRVTVPWFALGFVAMVLFNSLQWLPAYFVRVAVDVDTFLLAMAMAALGLTTHVSAIRKAGVKPLLLGLVLAFWLIVGGALINRWLLA